MKKVLLTGIAGFIGAHTLEHFLEKTDWEIVGIDSFRHGGKQARIDQVLSKNPEWVKRVTIMPHDLVVPFSIGQMEQIGKPDYIINMASESHVDRSISDPLPFVINNIALTVRMLEFARFAKPEKFIQISTDEVYGPLNNDDNPFFEWERYLPSNPYSASKASQEMIAISYWRTYGLPLIITNTMNNVGEMQDVEKFLPMAIRDIEDGQTVQIHSEGEEIGSRFYLHARNHSDALLYLLNNHDPFQYPDSHRPSKFNVASDLRLSNLEIAQKLAKLLNKPLKYELVSYHATRPGHDMHYGLNGMLLESIGWKPPIDFDESLRRTVDNYLEHKEWLWPKKK